MDQQANTILIVLAVIGVFALVMGVLIVAAIIGNKREKERTQQLKGVANMLGWQFSEAAPMTWIPNLEHFELFRQGHSKVIKNVVYGELEGMKAALFDYRYTVGHGKHKSILDQSVVYFEPRDLNAPLFSLRPEGTFHKIMAAFGYQDIDFGNRPTFSSKYLLRGADEPAVRSLFNDALLGSYEMNEGICTDGGGDQLFIFRQNHRTPPHESQAFINWALQMRRLFTSRW